MARKAELHRRGVDRGTSSWRNSSRKSGPDPQDSTIAVKGHPQHGMLLVQGQGRRRSSSCWIMRNTAIWRPALQSMSRASWWQRICGTASCKIFRRPCRNTSPHEKWNMPEKEDVVSRRSLKGRPRLCGQEAHRTVSDVPVYYESIQAMPAKMTKWIYTVHPIG